jgi:squalene-hopene/tetraprenyl-beta-curcumene cyclase
MSIHQNRGGSRRAASIIVPAVFMTIVAGWFAQFCRDPVAMCHEAARPSNDDGSPEIAAVATVAALAARSGYSDSDRIAERLAYLERFLGDDSSLASVRRQTFVVSFGLMALVEANEGGRYDRLIRRTVDRLKAAQWTAARGCADSDPLSGGTGYKPLAEPDLYHTSLAIESLRRAGVPARDPCMARAARFVSRCQSLPSGQSPAAPADATDRGGFSIVPASFDRSGDAPFADDSSRPYGSLTCAGVKSLIYCGVPKGDDRVKAALEWLRRNYTLDANPGMSAPRCRLYDYYLSLAAAMVVLGEDSVVDSNNVRHDWRRELQRVLEAEQQSDGSWVNPAEADNLAEAHPLVTTSLAVLTLRRIAVPGPGGPLPDENPPQPRQSRWL